ncbi:NUDIX hydrolase [Natronorarus salvus]|uniref:NUDIX hydrolase n=1 Tax=Natronorarus salvus TaxID=3117733 RepID=UPI002F262D9D
MGIADASRRRVRAELDRLEGEYGSFTVREKEIERDADAYGWIEARHEGATLGGAGAWVRNGTGEALLVQHGPGGPWSEPGGKHEAWESLEGTALRETREETGVEVDLRGMVSATVTIHRHGDEPPISRLVAVFDARYRSGTPRPEPGEIHAVRWWDRHPDELRYPEIERYPIGRRDEDSE